jgi:hypothetical protein
MSNESYFKKLFFIGALWNFGAAVLFYFFHRPVFSFLGMQPVGDSLFVQLFSAAVFLFGVGYYWVSKDLKRNHGILKLGIAGKILVFAIMTYHFTFHGCLHWLIASAGVVDVIFAVLFIQFLINFKKQKEPTSKIKIR